MGYQPQLRGRLSLRPEAPSRPRLDANDNSAMPSSKGCARCRFRHIRCVIPPGASSCSTCTRLGHQCCIDPPFQFKSVNHVYQTAGGTSSRIDLTLDDRQIWVDIAGPVQFITESFDLLESDSNNTECHDTLTSTQHTVQQPESPSGRVYTSPNFSDHHVSSTPFQSSCPQIQATSVGDSTPSEDPYIPALSVRDAFLLRLYTQKIAPWADICDPQAHFANEVPRRALQDPMLLKALLALSSRYSAMMTDNKDWEASTYHGECLEMLIAALDKAENYNDNMLITVVVLRLYEELENNTDQKLHLLGSNQLLNYLSHSVLSGGLAEATSWQFLRQAIYSSIAQYQPIELDLGNFDCSSVFNSQDDAAYANVMIYLCAKVLQNCWNAHDRPMDRDVRQDLVDQVDRWYESKPISWKPLRYQEMDLTANRPFPVHWMLSASSVVGLQYYHTARIFLAAFDRPPRPSEDFDYARLRRITEQTIANHLVHAIGLCISNENVENSYFTPSNLLQRFGYCLQDPIQQHETAAFLLRVEKVIGWRTSWIVRKLEDQWSTLASLNRPSPRAQ